MKIKHLLFVMLSVLTLGLAACGNSGGEGLNGALTVSAAQVGTVVNATVTYSNPTQTNLTGVEIEFSYRVGNGAVIPLGSSNTNNSGAIVISFTPAAVVGETVTVIAKTGNLNGLDSVVMAAP